MRPGRAGNVATTPPRQVLGTLHWSFKQELLTVIIACLIPLFPSPTTSFCFLHVSLPFSLPVSPDFAGLSRRSVSTRASVLVLVQVVSMATGAVVTPDEVVAELRALNLGVVPAFVKVWGGKQKLVAELNILLRL